mgnify:CR=1 FL=1
MKNTNNTKLSSKEACTLAHQIRRETGCSLAEAFKAAYSRNTVSAEPKTSWTMNELVKLFSDKTAELLRKGYILDPVHMSGHQGEIAKVLFTKDGEYFQLIMESHSDFGKWYGEQIEIRFGKYTEEVRPARSLTDWSDTLWVNKFDTQWSMTVAQIADNYYVTPELAEQFSAKAHERRHNYAHDVWEEVDSKYYKAILACVRKQKGYKSTKINNIVKVTRITRWNDFDLCYNRRYYKVELNSKLDKYGKNTVVDVRF